MSLEKIEVHNRWSGKVQFTAEIEVSEWITPRLKLGLAVKWARKSGADLRGADLRDAILSGADLSGADLSGADLRGAILRGAILRGADLRGAILSGADLSGAILRGADLRDAILSDADLRGADLSGAILRGAVLHDCPVKIENIHQKVYEAASADGALDMGTWHKHGNFCGTTHCRAGWVNHLAGDGGRALEFAMGAPAAAALIYMASDLKLERIPNFYAGNESALADMKAMAEAEKSA